MRFYEHPLGVASRIAYAVRWLGAGIAAGGGIGFLVTLGIMLTLQESFSDLFEQLALDAPSRALIGLLFVALAAGVIVFAFADSALNWTLARQLRRAAGTTPELVPPRDQRRVLTLTSPSTAATAALWVIIGCAVLALLIVLAIVGETSDDELPMVQAMIGVLAATIVVGILATSLVRRARLRVWPGVAGAASAVFSEARIAEAASAEKALRPKRLDRITPAPAFRPLSLFSARALVASIALLLGGAAVGFIGVWMRQPCRTCSERSWESFGESLIDLVLIAGMVLVVIGFLAAVAGFFTGIAASTLELRNIRGAAEFERPAFDQLQRQLVGTPQYLSIGIVLAALGTIAAVGAETFAVAAEAPLTTYRTIFESIAIGGLLVLAAAFVVFAFGEAATTRWHNVLRARWSPGDIEPERPAPRQS